MRQILLRFSITIIAAVLITPTVPPAVFAQDPPKPIRLRFPRRSHTTTARGLVGGEATNYYIVYGRAGQTLTVHAISRRKRTQVGVTLAKDYGYVPGIQKDSDLTRWKGKLPSTGDYLIQVNVSPYSEWYTLKVTLR